MDINTNIKNKSKKEIEEIMNHILSSYLNPAFGSLPKREIDLIFLDTLQSIGALSQEPSLYELVTKLRITRTKARSLLYDQELRQVNDDELHTKAIQVLTKPLLFKDGEAIKLEVENPLISDHIRYMFQNIGAATDGSFSSSLIKISANAYIKLIEVQLNEDNKNALIKNIKQSGIDNYGSFHAVVKSALSLIGKSVAGNVGEEITQESYEAIACLWHPKDQKCANSLKKVLKQNTA